MYENKPLLKYDCNSAMEVAKNKWQGNIKRILCVCSAGILRSATAAVVLSQDPYNFNTRSAGIEQYALVPVSQALLHWADEVVCMTRYHEEALLHLTNKPITCLDLPDCFSYRDPTLITEIKQRYYERGIYAKN